MCNTSSPDCLCPRRLNLTTEVPGQQPALTSGLGDPAEPRADPAPLEVQAGAAADPRGCSVYGEATLHQEASRVIDCLIDSLINSTGTNFQLEHFAHLGF